MRGLNLRHVFFGWLWIGGLLIWCIRKGWALSRPWEWLWFLSYKKQNELRSSILLKAVHTTGAGCCSVSQSCQTLCDPMDHSTPGSPVLRYLPEFTQTHIHWVDDAIQPSHPLSSPSPPALNLSQHQDLFQWVGSSHQVAKARQWLKAAKTGEEWF